jgi:hypothetical protein
MKPSYIRPATADETISILSEWQIATKLSKPVMQCLGVKHNYTLVVILGYKLLISYRKTKKAGMLELHIACPRASIKASRILTAVAMQWLLTEPKLNADTIVVFAPKGKMSNFAKRLGFKEDNSIKSKANKLTLTFKRG